MDSPDRIIDNETTVFWFRRDLRINDNAGLYHALRKDGNVIGLFIFDKIILNELEDKFDKRVEFIHQSVIHLKTELEKYGSSLLVVHDDPKSFFQTIGPLCVYANGDYEPYARKRDQDVAEILAKKNCELKLFKDQVIFEKNEVIKDDQTPYTVFTPYSRKWKSRLNDFYKSSYPTTAYIERLKKISALAMPEMSDIGFASSDFSSPPRIVRLDVVRSYHEMRDFPGEDATTRLSVHLRFGTISIRRLVQIACAENQKWLDELIWREFYQMILWHFPLVEQAFKRKYDRIAWRNDEEEFRIWCHGMTGYPLVDAGMRELNQTGFMHNRVRMVAASFLTKHLLIDWRWGEAYFAKKLLDFDLASNNGGWQWAAGSGCDAAPYFRIFNPEEQRKKFDAGERYIRRWIPEFGTDRYPVPMVDHIQARERALRAYQKALGHGEQ